MNRVSQHFIPFIFSLLFFALLGFQSGFAQPMYNMSNLVVDDCQGILIDSELGDPEGTYDHNENYTFTICVPGVDQIIMNFTEFCTEFGFDSLRIYDGPDTLSFQFGMWTGEDDPPQIVATSGCLTINFISDPNVTCTGWNAMWTTEFEIPEPPAITSPSLLACESDEMTITFGESIPCDAVTTGAFQIFGPQLPSIISAIPINCTNDSTNMVLLTFNPPIDFSGNYDVQFTQTVAICEEEFVLISTGNFVVNDCPLNVEIMLDGNAGCIGDSITLIAEASGGIPENYNYTWNVFAPDTNQISTIIWGPTFYYVTVTDGLVSATDSLLVEPNSPPNILPGDTTICESVDPFVFDVWPPDGTWWGEGIHEDEMESGLYQPDLVNESFDILFYEDPNGCLDSIFVNITPLDEGTDDGVCFGLDSFYVSGGLPIGGTWTGAFINPDGLFHVPDSVGNFEVIYTHPNGCMGSKFVNVDSLITFPELDSLCQFDQAFEIPVLPFGGNWTGTGIIDTLTGEFSPEEANQGDNFLHYELNGCEGDFVIHVREINATGNLDACPEEDPFILPGDWQPMGLGVWSGTGIIDLITGLYDPSLLPNGARDTLTFSANGCTDSRIVFIRQTEIESEELFQFCPEDESFDLDRPNTGIRPRRGMWTGAGVTNPDDDEYLFDPNLAGSGFHTLVYEKNTCTDTMVVEVFPTPIITEMEFCDIQPPQILEANPPNGTWSGAGIINEFQGVFDPGALGAGTWEVFNESENGCVGSGNILINAFQEAIIDSLDQFYCYKTIDIPVELSFPNGTLSLNGDTILNSFINPAQLGTGQHHLIFTLGEGECKNTDEWFFEVGEPVGVVMPFEVDSICFDVGVNISAEGFGGSSQNNFTYIWDNNLGFGQSHLVSPDAPTSYQVEVNDGCSDPAFGILTVHTFPPIFVEYITGEQVCYDDTTFAEVFAFPGDNYSFIWDTEPPTNGNFLETNPSTYEIEVIDNETNCAVTEAIELPGFSIIQANFDVSPNQDCLSSINPTIQILDFSIGGKVGSWNFGDGSERIDYDFGQELFHTFPDTGYYTITLHIENEGSCISEHQVEVCVEAEHRLFAPNAMTPNNDGQNDIFQFVGSEIEEIKWQIYDRHGALLYESNDVNDSWNGMYKGKFVPQGGYVYCAKYKAEGIGEAQVLSGVLMVMY